jgi:hypothetical protein
MVFTFFHKIEKRTFYNENQNIMSNNSKKYKPRTGKKFSPGKKSSYAGKKPRTGKKFSSGKKSSCGKKSSSAGKKKESDSIEYDSDTKNELICLLFISLCPNKQPTRFNLKIVSIFLDKKIAGWENFGLLKFMEKKYDIDFGRKIQEKLNFLDNINPEAYHVLSEHLNGLNDCNEIVVKYKSLMSELHKNNDTNFYEQYKNYHRCCDKLKELSADCIWIFNTVESGDTYSEDSLAPRKNLYFIDYHDEVLADMIKKGIPFSMKLKECQINAFKNYFSKKKISYSDDNVFKLLIILSQGNVDNHIYQQIINGKFDDLEKTEFCLFNKNLKDFLSKGFLSDKKLFKLQYSALHKLVEDNTFNKVLSFTSENFGPVLGDTRTTTKKAKNYNIERVKAKPTEKQTTILSPFSSSTGLTPKSKQLPSETTSPVEHKIVGLNEHLSINRKLKNEIKDKPYAKIIDDEWTNGRPKYLTPSDKTLLLEYLNKLPVTNDPTPINDLLKKYAISIKDLYIEELTETSVKTIELKKNELAKIQSKLLEKKESYELASINKKKFEASIKVINKLVNSNFTLKVLKKIISDTYNSCESLHFKKFAEAFPVKEKAKGDKQKQIKQVIMTMQNIDIKLSDKKEVKISSSYAPVIKRFEKNERKTRLNNKTYKEYISEIVDNFLKLRQLFREVNEYEGFSNERDINILSENYMKIGREIEILENGNGETDPSEQCYFLKIVTSASKKSTEFKTYDFTKLKDHIKFWELDFEKELKHRKIQRYIIDYISDKKGNFDELTFDLESSGFEAVTPEKLKKFLEYEQIKSKATFDNLGNKHKNGIITERLCFDLDGKYVGNNSFQIPKTNIEGDLIIKINDNPFDIKRIDHFDKTSVVILSNLNLKFKVNSINKLKFYKVQYNVQNIKRLIIKDQEIKAAHALQKEFGETEYIDDSGKSTDFSVFLLKQESIKKKIKWFQKLLDYERNQKVRKTEKEEEEEKKIQRIKNCENEIEKLQERYASFYQKQVNELLKKDELTCLKTVEELENLLEKIKSNFTPYLTQLFPYLDEVTKRLEAKKKDDELQDNELEENVKVNLQ